MNATATSLNIVNVSILRPAFGDCSNGGVSSKDTSLKCVVKHYGHRDSMGSVCRDAVPFSADEALIVATYAPKGSVIYVCDMPTGTPRHCLVSAEALLSGKWYMFGGNWGESNDLRYETPVKIHDRIEG